MGHAEKFIMGRNNRETMELLDLIKEYKSPLLDSRLLELTTFKQNKNIRYREVLGLSYNGKGGAFTFNTIEEIENLDKFYRKPSPLEEELANMDEDEFDPSKLTKYYGNEEEIFMNKGTKMIWIDGNRADINDIYRILGITQIAYELVLAAYEEGAIDDDMLYEGKIDIEAALAKAEKTIAEMVFKPEQLKLIQNARVLDLDGIKDVDCYIANPSIMGHKQLGPWEMLHK